MAIIMTQKLEAVLAGVNRFFAEKDAHIEICRNHIVCRSGSVEVGVNWAGCGTQSPDDTKKFAKNLKKAAKICKVINAYQWEEMWGTCYKTGDEYYDDVNRIYDALLTGIDLEIVIDQIV